MFPDAECFAAMKTLCLALILEFCRSLWIADSLVCTKRIANAGSDPNGDVMSGGIFSFARFKADGVTPDPFTATPEPGACGLALAGLALVGVWRRRR